jgi:aspartate racemase
MSQLGVPIKHIVGSVATELKSLKIYSGTIGIIGTKATMSLGLYQRYLNDLGWSCITPSTTEMDTYVQPAIELIKANDIEAAHKLLMIAIDKLLPYGVNAIVLGCTEIPLAIKETQYKNIPLVNSIDSLVKLVIKEFDRP